jgi:hypothetical protein
MMQDHEDNRVWVACPTCSTKIEMPNDGSVPRLEDGEPDWGKIQPIATRFAHQLRDLCRYAETMTHDGSPPKSQTGS